MDIILPLLMFVGAALGLSLVVLILGVLIGPQRQSAVKRMPYESGVDPVHDTHRRFDVRFHLVAIVFLIFDVELLFLYPWAVASRQATGIDAAVQEGWISHRGWVFGGAMFFLALVVVGLLYDWRKGVLRWR
ncbi:MAG: NADH-quinone oxidoreductase subunit A [Pirellulales bacterium]